MPEDAEGEIRMGDAVVGKSKAVTVKLINTSEKPLRFDWKKPALEAGEIKFKPSVGHLAPKEEKDCKIVFKSDKELKIAKD